jgi:hypothetical protein
MVIESKISKETKVKFKKLLKALTKKYNEAMKRNLELEKQEAELYDQAYYDGLPKED